MLLISLFAIVGHPLYYLIWGYLFPQPYDNVRLRAAGMLIAIPTLFAGNWPPAARKYLPAYWYIFIMLAVPFFFGFMLLENGVNTAWSGSFTVAIAIVFLTFDFVSAACIVGAGMTLAFSVYLSTAPSQVPWDKLLEQTPVYLFAIAVITVFNLDGARQTRAKIAAAMAFGGHIAHELRTPLATIQAATSMIGLRLPGLLTALREAVVDRTAIGVHDNADALIRDAPEVITREVDYALLVIELALTNTGLRPFGAVELQGIYIAQAVASAIERYPFKDQPQRDWIHVAIDADAKVNAIPILIEHVMFNLLKNSIYAIQAAGRGSSGEIRIHLTAARRRQHIHVRDNGQGITPSILPHVFEPFFSTRANGTGLGLHFCRSVMSRFGGDIRCQSVRGEFTEMILEFPVPENR